MRYAEVATLIKEIRKQNPNGYTETEQERKDVFCDVKSVKRSEYYASMAAGIKLDLMIRIRNSEYTGQELIEYDGKNYKIIRAYTDEGEMLELTCAEVKR